MVAGADTIDDMRLLRHGGMRRVFRGCYAPSTLGSFLRAFRFGHVRQLDAVAARFLAGLAVRAPLLPGGGPVLVDLDDTVIEVHGYAKQGAGFGYTKVRGLNAVLATATTPGSAPVVVAQRLRKGSAHSARGAKRLVADTLKTVSRLAPGRPVLLRADSAFYGADTVDRRGQGRGAGVSHRPPGQAGQGGDRHHRGGSVDPDRLPGSRLRRGLRPVDLPGGGGRDPLCCVRVPAGGPQTPGRLVVRRIPELNPTGQDGLFDLWRFHAFFTTSASDTVTADKTHRGHAIIEQVHADLKHSALAHLPSGVFTANAAWLVLAVIAFNLTRAAATLTGGRLATATTPTLRRTLIAVPARIAHSARRLLLHLPAAWPWQDAFNDLFQRVCGPPATAPA